MAEIDWRFDVPPELSGSLTRNSKDTTVETDPDLDDFVDEEEVDAEITSFDGASPDVTPDLEGLYPPDNIVVIDQQVNTLADGTQLVDLVIDIDNVPAANKYVVKYVRT